MWCTCHGAGNNLSPEGGKAIGQALAASKLTNLNIESMSWMHGLAMICAYWLPFVGSACLGLIYDFVPTSSPYRAIWHMHMQKGNM